MKLPNKEQLIMNVQLATVKSGLVLGLGFALCAASQASDINLSVESGGSNTISVFPGDMVNFAISGELSDASNQGLAMFAFDLSYDGGSLSPVSASAAMAPFIAPQGINNPAGFGGTLSGGGLLQVGGAQNTINNTFAAQPIGSVQLGLGLPGSPVQIATGTVTTPLQPGTYTLSISNVFANAVDPTTTGQPFWRVQGTPVGTVNQLTIIVSDCSPVEICTSLVNSLSCKPLLTSSGYASFSNASHITFELTEIINEEFGIALWSTVPGTTMQFGTTLCVGTPYQFASLPTRSGGGGAPYTSCDGIFRYTVDAAFLQAHSLMPGTTVYTQVLYRDRQQVGTTVGLGPGMSFVVCP